MRDYLELIKPRITLLILVCTAVGYWFGCGSSFRLVTLVCTLLGTALLASGTSALNQWYEVDSDSKMYRTRSRPIPTGRMTRPRALVFGILLAAAGFVELWSTASPLAAGLGLFTLLSYLLIYTPLKQHSPICTTIGAIAGAMPPVIGYTAAGRGIDAEAVALFLILFVWQFPHFDAIAWMYRDDYARGGIRMLPVIDSTGEATARRVVLYSLLLIPASLLPRWLGMTGSVYVAAAIAAGLALLCFSVRLAHKRNASCARAVLVASVVYLPIVLAVMVADRRVL